MEPLRCLIADIPQKLLADILQRVTQQDEQIEMVGQVANVVDAVEILQKQNIDVLVMGVRDEAAHRIYRDILQQFPQLLIVGLVNDGRVAVFCLADPGSKRLINLISELGIKQVITRPIDNELI